MFKNLISRKPARESDLVEVDPINELTELRASFERALSRLWKGDWEAAWNAGWDCDIKDSENEIVIRAEAPGFDLEEFDVRLSGNRLVVQAEHKSEKANGKKQVSHYNRFYRAMTVPSGIESDKIEASYKNGILEVRLPKGQEARSKRIAVTTK